MEVTVCSLTGGGYWLNYRSWEPKTQNCVCQDFHQFISKILEAPGYWSNTSRCMSRTTIGGQSTAIPGLQKETHDSQPIIMETALQDASRPLKSVGTLHVLLYRNKYRCSEYVFWFLILSVLGFSILVDGQNLYKVQVVFYRKLDFECFKYFTKHMLLKEKEVSRDFIKKVNLIF